MPIVSKPDEYVLRPDQHAFPILWIVGPLALRRVPDCGNELMKAVFGEGKSQRLKSWGHDPHAVHWLATRSGTALHTDDVFTRYTHHLLLRNDGFRLRGLVDDQTVPPLTTGHLYCLDTHSPHKVVVDERLAMKPLYKLQVVIDSDSPMEPKKAFEFLEPMLKRNPAQDLYTLKQSTPRPKDKTKERSAEG